MAKSSGGTGRSGRGGGGASSPQARIMAAAQGQPAIVREAMMGGGVSVIRNGLTAQELRQLNAARRAGLLEYARGGISRTFVVSSRVAFGS